MKTMFLALVGIVLMITGCGAYYVEPARVYVYDEPHYYYHDSVVVGYGTYSRPHYGARYRYYHAPMRHR